MIIKKGKKHVKLLIIFMVIFSMVVPTFAEENYRGKEEVVYAILNGNGSIDDIYVVNIFDKNGKIEDYGDYSKVRNMTTNDEILVDGNQITINNTGDKLYYEGILKENDLPWNVDIKYDIDDIEYSAGDIAGKSGALTIRIKIDENKNVNDNFYENYAIQALVTLDTNKAKDIMSKQATMANVGKDKQLTYTILPGKGADITIRANVEDFEMDEISINGINLNLDIEIDDSSLKGKVDELLNGVNKIDNGAREIKDSAWELKGATDKLTLGVKEVENGSKDLEKGILSLEDGIIQMENALGELNAKSDPLTRGSAEFKSALIDVQRGLGAFSLQNEMDENTVQLWEGINLLVERYTELDKGINQYTDGVGRIVPAYKSILEGGSNLGEGSQNLRKGSGLLYDNMFKISEGTSDLYNGTVNLSDGTGEFKSKTSNIDIEVQNGVDEILFNLTGDKSQITSFVSSENREVRSVQFVIRTNGIKIEELVVMDENTIPKLTFWEKILKLFKFANRKSIFQFIIIN